MRLAGGTRSLLALATVALLAVACGGSSNTTSQSSPSPSPSPSPSKAAGVHYATVDACTLVSAADATTAAGATLTQLPTGGGASTASICIYGSQSSDSSQAGVLLIAEVYADKSTADAIQTDQVAAGLAAQFGVSGVANAKVVNNIGDKAVEYQVSKTGGGAVGIFVFRANVVMFLIVSPAVAPTDQTKADALTAKVETLANVAVTNLDKAPHT